MPAVFAIQWLARRKGDLGASEPSRLGIRRSHSQSESGVQSKPTAKWLVPSGAEAMLSLEGWNSFLGFLDIVIHSTDMHWSLSQCRKCCVRKPTAKSLSSFRAVEVLNEHEPSRSRWGNWGSRRGEFLQGWSTGWPDTIGISTCRQLFWPLHPSHASPGVLPGGSSTSQPNVPDVHAATAASSTAAPIRNRVRGKKWQMSEQWTWKWRMEKISCQESQLTRVTSLRL